MNSSGSIRTVDLPTAANYHLVDQGADRCSIRDDNEEDLFVVGIQALREAAIDYEGSSTDGRHSLFLIPYSFRKIALLWIRTPSTIVTTVRNWMLT